jgi:hypothetical protein
MPQNFGADSGFRHCIIDFRQGPWHNLLQLSVAILNRRVLPMSIQADLVELEQLHRALEREIQEELAHPGSDDLKLAELKRRKLQLKDRIEQLKHETSATVH